MTPYSQAAAVNAPSLYTVLTFHVSNFISHFRCSDRHNNPTDFIMAYTDSMAEAVSKTRHYTIANFSRKAFPFIF